MWGGVPNLLQKRIKPRKLCRFIARPLIAAAQQQAVREALALAKTQWPALSEPVVFVEEGDVQPWSGTALASLLTKMQALRNLMR